MQNDKSTKRGARTHHSEDTGEVLAPAELADAAWGAEFQRVILSAAARLGIYGPTALAREVGISRITVAGWWNGSRPQPQTVARLARALGLDVDETRRWVYDDGPPPDFTPSPEERDRVLREAREWADGERRRPDAPQDRRRE